MLAELRLSGGINALAHQLGERPAVIFALVEELLPGVLAEFGSFAGGLGALITLLEDHGGGSLAAAVMSHEQADPQPGTLILQRLPAANLDVEASGASAEQQLRARLMPLLIMLTGGYLAARAAAGNWKRGELEALLKASDSRPSGDDEQV